jgi:putative hemolysin
MVEQSTEIEAVEQEIVENTFDLGDRRVSSLMTPRIDLDWLDLQDPPETIRKTLIENPDDVFPVCNGGPDHVAGFVRASELFAHILMHNSWDIRPVVREPLFVPAGVKALKLLELFREKRITIAFVIDEYGMLEGIVTLQHVMEELVGEIDETPEPDEATITPREDGSWLVDGLVTLDEFFEYFDLEEDDYSELEHINTVAGLALSRLNHIPKATERFEWQQFQFEVVDMDGNRVDKLLVSRKSG